MRKLAVLCALCGVAAALLLGGCPKKEEVPGSAEGSVPPEAKAMMEKQYGKGGVPGSPSSGGPAKSAPSSP